MRSSQFPRCCKIYNIYDFGGDNDSWRDEPSVESLIKRINMIISNKRNRALSNQEIMFIAPINSKQVNSAEALLKVGFKISPEMTLNTYHHSESSKIYGKVYIYTKVYKGADQVSYW